MDERFPGMILAIEGPDGAGKTTLAGLVHKKLNEAGVTAIRHSDPGGTPLGKSLKGLLHMGGAAKMAEFFMLMAAQADNLEKVLLPALQRGALVVSDRGPLSTDAYQIHGKGLDPVFVKDCLQGLGVYDLPYLHIVLTLPPEVALARSIDRDGDPSYYEKDKAMMDRITARYAHVATKAHYEGWPVTRLNAMRTPEEMANQVIAVLAQHRDLGRTPALRVAAPSVVPTVKVR